MFSLFADPFCYSLSSFSSVEQVISSTYIRREPLLRIASSLNVIPSTKSVVRRRLGAFLVAALAAHPPAIAAAIYLASFAREPEAR